MVRGNLRVYVNDVPVKETRSKERYVLVSWIAIWKGGFKVIHE